MYEPNINMEYISLKRVHDAAILAGGEQNGFKFIQMPYNFYKDAHLYLPQPKSGRTTLIQCQKLVKRNNKFKLASNENIFKTVLEKYSGSPVLSTPPTYKGRCSLLVRARRRAPVGKKADAEHVMHDMPVPGQS